MLDWGSGGWFGHQAAIFFTYLFLGVKEAKKVQKAYISHSLVYFK